MAINLFDFNNPVANIKKATEDLKQQNTNLSNLPTNIDFTSSINKAGFNKVGQPIGQLSQGQTITANKTKILPKKAILNEKQIQDLNTSYVTRKNKEQSDMKLKILQNTGLETAPRETKMEIKSIDENFINSFVSDAKGGATIDEIKNAYPEFKNDNKIINDLILDLKGGATIDEIKNAYPELSISQPAKDQGFFENMRTSLNKRGEAIMGNVKDTKLGYGLSENDKWKNVANLTNTVGQVLGTASDLYSEGLSQVTPEVIKAPLREGMQSIINTEPVQSGIKQYGEFKKENPYLAKTVEGGTNIGLTLLGGKGLNATEQGFKETGKQMANIYKATPNKFVGGVKAGTFGVKDTVKKTIVDPIVDTVLLPGKIVKGTYNVLGGKKVNEIYNNTMSGFSKGERAGYQSNPFQKEEVIKMKMQDESPEGIDNIENYKVAQHNKLSDELEETINKLKTEKSENGAIYNDIKNLNIKVDTEDLFNNFKKTFDKYGIEITPEGQLVNIKGTKGGTISDGDIIKMQKLLDNLVADNINNGGGLSVEQILKGRSDASVLANYDKVVPMTNEGSKLFKELRGHIDSTAKGQIPGLKELDVNYSDKLEEIAEGLKDLIYKGGDVKGEFKSNLVNIVSNLDNANRAKLAGRLEEIMPGITQKVKAINNLTKIYKISNDASKIKGFTSGGYFGVAGALSGGPLGAVIGSIAGWGVGKTYGLLKNKAINNVLNKVTPERLKQIQQIQDKIKAKKIISDEETRAIQYIKDLVKNEYIKEKMKVDTSTKLLKPGTTSSTENTKTVILPGKGNIKTPTGNIGKAPQEPKRTPPTILKKETKLLPAEGQSSYKKPAIITPQTKESGVILESKKGLENTKFGNNKTISGISQDYDLAKQLIKDSDNIGDLQDLKANIKTLNHPKQNELFKELDAKIKGLEEMYNNPELNPKISNKKYDKQILINKYGKDIVNKFLERSNRKQNVITQKTTDNYSSVSNGKDNLSKELNNLIEEHITEQNMWTSNKITADDVMNDLENMVDKTNLLRKPKEIKPLKESFRKSTKQILNTKITPTKSINNKSGFINPVRIFEDFYKAGKYITNPAHIKELAQNIVKGMKVSLQYSKQAINDVIQHIKTYGPKAKDMLYKVVEKINSYGRAIKTELLKSGKDKSYSNLRGSIGSESISKEGKDLIYKYTNSGGGTSKPMGFSEQKQLSKEIIKLPKNKETTYSGLKLSTDDVYSLKNNEWTTKRVLSTSTDRKTAEEFADYNPEMKNKVILTIKGGGHNISEYSAFQKQKMFNDENEILFPVGQKFKVEEIGDLEFELTPIYTENKLNKPKLLKPVKELEPLINEAKKYKTFDEFKKGQTGIYHGTDKKFDKFDLNKSQGGGIWFTNRKDLIEKGEVGASTKGRIIENFINEKSLKFANWDKYDKYSTDELINMGYDGVKFIENGENTYSIFTDKGINELKTEAQLKQIYEEVNKPKLLKKTK